VLSVYPQGLVYRAFFFERYRSLFPNPAVLIAMSAVAFSFAHIIFRNPIAVGFTLIGGFLFAWRYGETRSLFTSSFEHALYGCWMFTVGLGDYFYRGAR
jgi:membrane protease YdiL (CAAX protease family)